MTSDTASSSSLKLNDEQIDDLLYCARAGETDDLVAYLDELVAATGVSSDKEENKSRTKGEVLAQVHDGSENGMLHYACANGHQATLSILLPHASLATLLHLNKSGNTPLHWAGLNGHLGSAKLLVARIEEAAVADPQEAARIKAASWAAERARQAVQAERKEREEEQRRKAVAEAAKEGGDKAEGDGQVQSQSAPQRMQKEQKEEEAARSIWDIRNSFGRGPITEAQMNDQEAVVQFLLNHMVGQEGAAHSGEKEGASTTEATTTEEADDAELQKKTEASLKV